MIHAVDAATVSARLAQRLRAVTSMLLDATAPPPHEDPVRDADVLLDLLVRATQSDPTPERIWLLCVAVFGSYPTAEDVLTGIRFFQLAPATQATLWLLDRALDTSLAGTLTDRLEIVTDRVVVDVDHSARHDLHTGIQQVVRQTLPIWDRDHPVLAVAWTAEVGAWRALSGIERQRVLQWAEDSDDACDDEIPTAVVVPWHTVTVLLETPSSEACPRLAAVAQYSGNCVVAVGYDCVPIVSADLVPPAEPARFARYLTVLKHARRVAGISNAATAQFGGFSSALRAQGFGGPAVVSCGLPSESFSRPGAASPPRSGTSTKELPLVLGVGSFEPRKNHLAVLYAAERLWREGLKFELMFIAGSGWGDAVPNLIARLRESGRPITTRTKVSDSELRAAYQRARFTIFVSLHEGYGLPVAESLAQQTPVITTNYGSTADIAAGGGTVLVDPRDDEAIVDAMRILLTDDDALRARREEILSRPVRTWEHYAAELWDCLVPANRYDDPPGGPW